MMTALKRSGDVMYSSNLRKDMISVWEQYVCVLRFTKVNKCNIDESVQWLAIYILIKVDINPKYFHRPKIVKEAIKRPLTRPK